MFVAIVTWLMLNTEHETIADACWTLARENDCQCSWQETCMPGLIVMDM